MSIDLTIYGYKNVAPNGQTPRKPMVHLLAGDGHGSVDSITFHPDDAPAIAKAILRAGHGALTGRQVKPTKINLKPHD